MEYKFVNTVLGHRWSTAYISDLISPCRKDVNTLERRKGDLPGCGLGQNVSIMRSDSVGWVYFPCSAGGEGGT